MARPGRLHRVQASARSAEGPLSTLWPEVEDAPFATSFTAVDAIDIRQRVIDAVPEPLVHQQPIVDSDARFKVLRCGRRFGKTRFALTVAFRGHGPLTDDGEPLFRGIAQGMDVVWVAQDYPNLTTVVWREEFEPRFAPLEFATLNRNEHTVAIDGLGTLFCRPETAIDGIRGIGKRLGGVIIDEAAWLDLEHALQDVILAALIDNEGWLILMSTTNAASDGNTAKRTPSYFNLICEQIRKGERTDDWREFYGTAFDNPSLSHRAINDMIAEYAAESPKLKQEVYADLLRAGVGVALDQMSAERHLVPRFTPPDHWTHFGAFDWGFNHPYMFGWFCVDEDGNVFLVETVLGRQEQPDRIAAKVKATVPYQRFRYTVAGHDIWADFKARGENVPTLFEQFAAHKLLMVKANISRVAGLNNLRRYVQWRATETEPERVPRFRIMDTENNRAVLATLEAMQIDEKNIEDALKVDADAAGRGGDDAYDMVRYGLASRPLAAVLPTVARGKVEDHAREYDYVKRQFKPDPQFLDEFERGHSSRKHTRAVRMPRPRV
jgi:hypothetical protein